MYNDNVKEQVKAHLKDYLEEKGINTAGKMFTCLNPQHLDKHPSMSYNPRLNNVKCFSCGTSYDLISLYALDNKLDIKTDFKKIMEDLIKKYNINYNPTNKERTKKKPEISEAIKKENYTGYYKKCKKAITKTNYLQNRGISKEIIDKYGIGYDEKEKRVIFPLNDNSYIGRSTDETSYIKHFKPKGSSNVIFNEKYIKESTFNSVVWVCESIIDALSLEEAKKNIQAISLNSANNENQLISMIKEYDYKGVLVLALDTDGAGIETSRKLKEQLDNLDIQTLIFNCDTSKYDVGTSKIKDINEYLLANKEKLENLVNFTDSSLKETLNKRALKAYQQENVFNYLDTFKENMKDKENNKPLATGIDELDQALEGGFYKKNLVILGAVSSLGKTTLALQIADNIAKKGNEVLIFSLEMSRDELIAKSLSRQTFLKAFDMRYTALAYTTREILTGKPIDETYNNNQRKNLYNETLEEYKTTAQNIYITECDDSLDIDLKTINEKIKNHIAITGNKPFVIIDYLQIIQYQQEKLTDKQVVDKIVTNLKRIARNNDITILLISAFNRASYNQESNLASFRESSTIEYTSDVLLALQLSKLNGEIGEKIKVNTNQEQQKSERELTLKVLKNRNGRITDVTGITFYAKYNYLDFKKKHQP